MCTDCYNGCDQKISDKCVQYTNPDNTALGICQGDPLSKVETQIITSLVNVMNGTGITLASLSSCSFVDSNKPSQDLNVSTLIQALVTGQCTLKALYDALSAQVGVNLIFDSSCLTLPSNPTTSDIIKAIGNQLCALTVQVTAISSDYVKATQLNDLIAQYLSNQSGSTVQQNTKMIPYVAYEYYGSLSNFDNTGAGLSSAGFSKVYLCNGNNGTPDKRGRVAVGAIANVPGGTIDSAVDPTVSGNPNYNLKDKSGVNFVNLDITQIPSHSHTVNDNGHSHNIKANNGWNGHSFISSSTNTNPVYTGSTDNAVTGITINPTGGGQQHTNIQPSIAAYYIMFVPS